MRLSGRYSHSPSRLDGGKTRLRGSSTCSLTTTPIRFDASLEDGHPLRDASRPFVGTDAAPGPELVTEEYLQRQISEKMADAIARPFAFMWTRSHWPSTITRSVTDWPKREWGYRFHNAHGYATNVLEGQAYKPDFLFVSLPNPIYDGGDVKTGDCRTLPN